MTSGNKEFLTFNRNKKTSSQSPKTSSTIERRLVCKFHIIVQSVSSCIFTSKEFISVADDKGAFSDDYSNFRVVFNFTMKNKDDNPLVQVHEDNVYEIQGHVVHKLNEKKEDWAILKLKRPVNRDLIKPAEIDTNPVDDKAPLYVLGHPSGLPMKYAMGDVKENKQPNFFTTDLTTFSGNSGSPVFNRQNNKVVGILVRGGQDYIDGPDGKNILNSIPFWKPGTGEDVSRIIDALKDANLL